MRLFLCLFSLLLFAASHGAVNPPVHCANDTATANRILQSLKGGDKSPGDKMVSAALMLEGSSFDDYYRTDSVAALRINLESFTPLMFVNSVIALAKASDYPGVADWHTFFREFENVACRRGENKGFSSIMYHSSDWIGDNMARGNITELTENYSGAVAGTKSLDEMTRRRNDYAALADSATFEMVRMTEMGFRTHRVPYLKKETIKKKEIIDDLRNGDIIILVPNGDGVDYYDMGFVEISDGVPHLIHLSPQSKTVVRESESLARYLGLMTKHFQGYRILRVRE